MKQIKNIIAIAIVALMAYSCDYAYEAPDAAKETPKFEMRADEKFITVKELKDMNMGSEPLKITEDLVLKCVVVGDDESGNIYKSIYVQDTTGGTNLSIDHVNMYNIMPEGQLVYVRLKNMYVGNYAGAPQIGDSTYSFQYGPEMARYNWALEFGPEENHHFFPDGWPKALDKYTEDEVYHFNTVEIKSKYDLVGGKGMDYYCTVVTLKDIEMQVDTVVEGNDTIINDTWSTKQETENRKAIFADGSDITIRTSGYCNFYADKLPEGRFDLTGIFTVYRGTFQLVIRDRDDIHIKKDEPQVDNDK